MRHHSQRHAFASLATSIICLVTAVVAAPPRPMMSFKRSDNVVFTPDGKYLIGSVPGQTWRPTDIELWDAATGKVQLRLKGHGSNIWQMSVRKDGRRLVSNENWAVKIWDLRDRKEIQSFKTPAFTRTVLFVHDGRHVASGHNDGRIILWDAKTAARIRTLKGHSDWVTWLALSTDGRRLASASVDMTARVWDLASGKTISTFHGHKWYLNRVAFGPKGKRIVTSSDDMTARVWDVATGKPLHVLRGHKDWVVPVMFSRDGQWIVTGSNDQTVQIWDAKTGDSRLTLTGHTERVNCITFNPNGKLLVTADRDHNVKVWGFASLTQSLLTPKRP